MFDNGRIRGLYPSLSEGWTYLNAQESPQMPEKVAHAVSRAMRDAPRYRSRANGSLGGSALRSGSRLGSSADQDSPRLSASCLDAARQAVADLAKVSPEAVYFGPSRRVLMERLAAQMKRRVMVGAEVLVSSADEDCITVPWRQAARCFGAVVKEVTAAAPYGVVTPEAVEAVAGRMTSVVVFAAAQRHVGVVADVKRVLASVREASRAVTVVDVTVMLPYRVLDASTLGADVVSFDIAAIGGPPVSVLIIPDASVISAHEPEALREAIECEGICDGLLGGVPAAVDHLAALSESEYLPRRLCLETGVPAAARYTADLARQAAEGLARIPQVTVVGVENSFTRPFGYETVDRLPQLTFGLPRLAGDEVRRRLESAGVVVEYVAEGESSLLSSLGAFRDESAGTRLSRLSSWGSDAGSSFDPLTATFSSNFRDSLFSFDDSDLGNGVGEDAKSEPKVAVVVSFAAHNTSRDVEKFLTAVGDLG